MILNRLQSNEQKWAKTCAIWNKLHRACLRPAFWPQRRDIAKLEHELFSYGTCAQPRASFIKPELSLDMSWHVLTCLDMSWHTFLRDTVSTLIPACTPRNRQFKMGCFGTCMAWMFEMGAWWAEMDCGPCFMIRYGLAIFCSPSDYFCLHNKLPRAKRCQE